MKSEPSRVFVYRNLHKKCYSVRDETSRRVAFLGDSVLIENATLVVGKKGRERVLRERRKNVHAGIRGNLRLHGATAFDLFAGSSGWVQIYYNPYTTETFVVKESGAPLLRAACVFLGTDGAFALLEA